MVVVIVVIVVVVVALVVAAIPPTGHRWKRMISNGRSGTLSMGASSITWWRGVLLA